MNPGGLIRELALQLTLQEGRDRFGTQDVGMLHEGDQGSKEAP